MSGRCRSCPAGILLNETHEIGFGCCVILPCEVERKKDGASFG